jgi:hypothetical protein
MAPWMVELPNSLLLRELDMPPRGFLPGVGVDPKEKVFPKLVLEKNPPGPEV